MQEKLNKELKSIDREIDRYNGRIENTLKEIKERANSKDIDRVIGIKHEVERLEKYQQHLEDLQDRKESLLYILEG